ncbi:M20 family metallopeptidase [Caloramator sp. E03]|uniref:peptidase dimerization domain-containing protein n=1 Tax=Caloramator sp. E03 TaxID=2576307 RepID=UPI001110797C|nr:peptidase dimerization domain-containing protein [Caloramator sp. E03]QCX32900.1 M20 family metallopeptidase [Caloramator sp. E03]
MIGKGGHSSKPEKTINPITKFISFINKNIKTTWVLDLGKLFIDGDYKGIGFELNVSGKCGEITIVPTILNIFDGNLSATFSIRYPENVSLDFIENKIGLIFNPALILIRKEILWTE